MMFFIEVEDLDRMCDVRCAGGRYCASLRYETALEHAARWGVDNQAISLLPFSILGTESARVAFVTRVPNSAPHVRSCERSASLSIASTLPTKQQASARTGESQSHNEDGTPRYQNGSEANEVGNGSWRKSERAA